ncbi:MAG: SixA phosphatase family protein [Minwuia sp.]|uniref:SixA phosphatase family protein n=1 Tax=Minwuia sp. TaxID=2493630 RepID=UPI003A863062
MKTLYLLRHAKSAWGDPQLSDHDRPLNARGRNAAARMGRYFAENGIQPARVFVSTSVRTRETWKLLSAEAPDLPAPVFADALYHAPPGVYMRLVGDLTAEVPSALFVAHSPGIEQLARSCAAEGDAADMAALREKYPTGALTELAFSGGWSKVGPGGGRLVRFVQPRLLDSE